MTLSRRTLFFLVLGVISLVMLPPTPSEFRALNVGMAGLAFFWTIMLALEDAALARGWRRRNREGSGRDGRDEPLRRA